MGSIHRVVATDKLQTALLQLYNSLCQACSEYIMMWHVKFPYVVGTLSMQGFWQHGCEMYKIPLLILASGMLFLIQIMYLSKFCMLCLCY